MVTSKRPISKIEDVYCHFIADLNYRRFIPGVASKAEDFKGVSAGGYMKWLNELGIDRIAWIQMITQPGCTTFPSKIYPPMSGVGSDFYLEFCQRAKAEGKYVMSYSCGGDNFQRYEAHPEWFEANDIRSACLNATPFWDEHFEVVQEGLRLFPCDGFIYDMVFWNGRCTCDYCQKAYEHFYGEKMPRKHDSQRIKSFYLDSWSHWLTRAVRAVRDLHPDAEIFINHQYLFGLGVPLELQKTFDFAAMYIEYTRDSGKAEILRPFNGSSKPVICGDNFDPRNVAAILARRMRPEGYDAAIDYRTGRMLPLDCSPFKNVREEISQLKERIPYVENAIAATSHAAVLFTVEHDVSRIPELNTFGERFHPFLQGRDWEGVEYYIRECERLNLTCREVTLLEDLTPEVVSQYEVIFAPEIAHLPEDKSRILLNWIVGGGVLVANCIFGAMDANGKQLDDFADNGLLGVEMIEGPLDVSAYLTQINIDGENVDLDPPVSIGSAIKCEPSDAEPIGYGPVGAEKDVPLLWENRIGDGRVIYLAGRAYDSISSFHRTGAFREILKKRLLPLLRSRPFITDLESPAEVWLNAQAARSRLVLHILSFEKQLSNNTLSLRADLIGSDALRLVYPANLNSEIQGERSGDYVTFRLPRLHKHVIMTAEMGNSTR